MTKRIIILYLAIIHICIISHAQITVDINSLSSPGIFHVDSKNNNSTTDPDKYDDDVLVDNNGNLGIKTLTPLAKVHLKSPTTHAFRIEDTSQGNNKVLISNSIGEGKWSTVPTQGSTYTWKISQPSYTFSKAKKQLTGTVTGTGSLAGFSANANGYLSVAKGSYLMVISGDSTLEEYLIFTIDGTYANSTYLKVLDFPYEHYLNATTILVNFTQNANLRMCVAALDANRAMWLTSRPLGAIGAVGSIWYEITFIKLV